ncbi:rhodoquinone biosynthesis methyltransferase RquA [Iodobacter sp.]|uniref:rhodoquinone biosynthesis methyltransferase RquA n=1 Tax=Iodobacter sp. TaxID=1915058 RepID=UPI0025EB2E48|nr:rhodoquinone biosynthesis methyltransferase RquA [Iodobacter sp.]
MTQNHPKLPTDPYYEGVPDYMTEVYDWAYVNPKRVDQLDHNMVVKVLLFGNDQRLMRAYLNEIKPGMKVWQVAHVYGDLVRKVAQKVGPDGEFHLSDITPAQIEHAQAKLALYPWAKVIRSDAATYQSQLSFDLICSFFLLHEVPDEKKRSIVDHMLSQMPVSGKVLFVDYHRPSLWQPIRWILKWVNAKLEPFAEALWNNEISHYASQAEKYHWQKRTIFGGVYQIVSVTRTMPQPP